MSPTQRTLAWLRSARFTAAVVEKWNPHAKLRQDLFGFIDIVAMHEGSPGLLGVQTTSGSGHSSRRAKILASPEARMWLNAENRIWIISWSKKGPRGKRKVWEPRIEPITLGMFQEAA